MSMYRFVKDNTQTGSSKRLFVQGTSSDQKSKFGPPIVTNLSTPGAADNLKAVYTKKRLSTEVLGSSFESTKTSKCDDDGRRRITTRIVRKVTTLTRGEEQSRAEDLTKKAAVKSIESAKDVAKNADAVRPKRVKVSTGYFSLKYDTYMGTWIQVFALFYYRCLQCAYVIFIFSFKYGALFTIIYLSQGVHIVSIVLLSSLLFLELVINR